jgi:hypothetical protein
MKPVDADYFPLLFGIQVNMHSVEVCPCISSRKNFQGKYFVSAGYFFNIYFTRVVLQFPIIYNTGETYLSLFP